MKNGTANIMSTRKVPQPSANKRGISFPLIISLIALAVSSWAANETRQTRLDTKRAQLRTETMEFIQENRTVANTFNCYALVKGAELQGKDDFMDFLAEQENLIRGDLAEIGEFSSGDLTTYEKRINELRGKARSRFNEKLIVIRNSWDKDLRDKADSVCKF